MTMRIPLMKPHLPRGTKELVCEVLDSGHLTEGPVTAEFESLVAKYVGVKHCIAVTSCTVGLEIALRSLGVGPGDEVILPDYTYPSTGLAVGLVGATAVIVDIDKKTLNIDYEQLEAAVTPATKAVVPVSLFGNPLDSSRLAALRDEYGFFIVEDAACSLGAEFNGEKTGTWADLAVFSCHPRKFVTTGEGGMIVTDNDEWARWIRSYKFFGVERSASRNDVQFQSLGTNSKMSDLLAAVGVCQMREVDSLLARRRALAENYRKLLSGRHALELPAVVSGGVHSYQSFCVLVENRDSALSEMRRAGIEVQIGTYSLSEQEYFKSSEKVRFIGGVESAQWAYDHCLALPLFHDMTFEMQERVSNVLLRILNEERSDHD